MPIFRMGLHKSDKVNKKYITNDADRRHSRFLNLLCWPPLLIGFGSQQNYNWSFFSHKKFKKIQNIGYTVKSMGNNVGLHSKVMHITVELDSKIHV